MSLQSWKVILLHSSNFQDKGLVVVVIICFLVLFLVFFGFFCLFVLIFPKHGLVFWEKDSSGY